MGFLNRHNRGAKRHGLLRLPTACFSVDRDNRVVISTMPATFPDAHVERIGKVVLDTFRGAAASQIPLREMVFNYGTLRIVARELRGGAIIFLIPSAGVRERGGGS
jgi:hypothetical protein